MNKKAIIIIVSIVVLLVLAGGIVYYMHSASLVHPGTAPAVNSAKEAASIAAANAGHALTLPPDAFEPSSTNTTTNRGSATVSSTTEAPSAGSADLIVTSMTVYPDHPVVNDPNLEITIAVKNVGTVELATGHVLTVEIVRSTSAVSKQESLEAVAPGQTVTFQFIPYRGGNPDATPDTAGEKTIQISGLGTGIFTQTVQMYAK